MLRLYEVWSMIQVMPTQNENFILSNNGIPPLQIKSKEFYILNY